MIILPILIIENQIQANFNDFQLQFKNQPQPNPTQNGILFGLKNSGLDQRFIGSDRIQNLQLRQNGLGQLATIFKINFFNRSLSNHLQSINVSKAGMWKTVSSSRSTLSCSLVFDIISSKYGLLKFSNQSKLQLDQIGTKDQFPTQMANEIWVGQMCDIFSFDKVPYLFNSSDATNPWVAVNVPNPSLNQGGSPDFSFVVTNNTLYQFNITNNSYSSVGTLPAFQKYDVKNSQGQLIIIGSNSSTDDNTTYTVNQTVIAGLIVPGENNLPTLKVISTDNVTGLSSQPSIPVSTSPQLTKLSFFFKPHNSTVLQIFIKSIDYKQQKCSALTFQNSAEFMDTLKNAGPEELNLGENFLLISNVSGLSGDPSRNVVKQYYQYQAQNIISIRKTVIPSNQTNRLSDFKKAMIDPNISDNLVVIQVFENRIVDQLSNEGNLYVQLSLGSLATSNATSNSTYNATSNATSNSTNNATSNATSNSTNNATSNATSNTTSNATSNNNNSSQNSTTATNTSTILQQTGIVVSQNITLSPPPPITSTVDATLPFSPVQRKFIGSFGVQSLKVSQTINPNSTIFTLNELYRQSSSNMKVYTITTNGLWKHLTSSEKSLSCSLVYNQLSKSISFLRFQDQSSKFYVYSNFLTASLPSPLTNATNTLLLSIVVGQDCNSFIYSSQIYNILPTALVKRPTLTNIQAYSPDLSYFISSNTLYAYSDASNTYNNLSSLETYPKYQLVSDADKIIAWGFSSSQDANRKYTVNQVIYIILNKQGVGKTFFKDKFTAYSNNVPSVPVYVSPQMTKVHYQYLQSTSNNTAAIYIYDIDYQQQKTSAITFKVLSNYLTTIKNMSQFTSANYFLGDYYLVIRNQSALPANVTRGAVENTYQFLGSSVMLLRSRSLPASEITNKCYKMAIDQYYLNSLVVVNLYLNSSGDCYNIYSFNYGSLATVVKVIPPKIPIYLQFTYPNHTSTRDDSSIFQWDFLNVNTANTSTIFSSYQQNQNATNSVLHSSVSVSGTFSLVIASKNCRLFKSTTSPTNYLLYTFTNPINLATPTYVNLTTTLSGKNPSSWKISDDCSKLYAAPDLFASSSSTFIAVNNVSNQAFFVSDDTITYALVFGKIMKYTANGNLIASVYSNPNNNYTSSAVIKSYSNRVIVYSITSSSIVIEVYIDNSNALSQISSQSFAFQSTPTISISPQMTKILIYGVKNSTLISNIFYVNYASLSIQSLSYPAGTFIDPNNYFAVVQDKWLYIRQLKSNLQTVAGGNLQYTYQILYDNIVRLAEQRFISSSDQNKWFRTKIRVLANGTLFVLTQLKLNTTQASVTLWQVLPSANQPPVPSTMAQVIINGQVKLCSPGCSSCSTGVCTSCLQGYTFDASSATCFVCAPGCSKCNPLKPASCSDCIDGAYLAGTSCLPCDASCITCQGSATSCKKCLPGQFFNGSSCVSCSRNCLNCTNSQCTLCRNGFVVANGSCRGCSRTCSNCLANNITSCTSCSMYLQLSQGSCLPCSSKCQSCSGNICAICDEGYHTASNGTCVPNCILPCKTCSDDDPNSCKSCYYGSALSGTRCTLDLACNTDSSCTDCGQGTGYILVGANCMQCGTISNCLQCSQTNSQACAICNSSYFLNGTKCSKCPAICTDCISQSICKSCVDGFTLPSSVSQGKCLACATPCKTCSGSITYCTSCVDGFTKKNWVCENNVNVGFSLILGTTDPAEVLNKIDKLIESLLRAMGLSTQKVQIITILSVKMSSVLVDATADPTAGISTSSSAANAASAALSSAISSGASFGGFSVTSSSVVTNGITPSTTLGTTPSTTPSTTPGNSTITPTVASTQNKLPLILGLSIGVPIFLILIVVISCVIYRRIKQAQLVGPSNDQNGVKVNETELATAKDQQGFHTNMILQVNADSHLVWAKETTEQP